MRNLILLFLLLIFNSVLFSQINTDLKFQSRRSEKEQIIMVNWSEADEIKWKEDNRDRLEIMALKTDLDSESLPKSIFRTTTYFFKLQSHSQIELLIEINSLDENEIIKITDQESGKILFSTADQPRKKFLTTSFDPSVARLEWSTSTGEYKSDFKIRTIYFHAGYNRWGGPTIGFGTSLPCHPNAACKQDSIMKLISNSTIRIRMVMNEGIGWCTGSFINNTRNDKTPYILLAYHCTFEYTPQYDMWRFDLEYRSESCENPASEPAFLSLVGCERKAGGQASDFLLVLLTEELPLNQKATFAGWNRDDVATPDTSYLIHHPNADIRKLSTSVNKAVIHPNQIGWTEGYITPANHHFRFKFTEGGHQHGSSGGPVYNQDGLIVAQLHGGTLGCEDVNSAFAGRLSKSWNLGPTPQERLRDWLDPDNTGLDQLPSIENLPSQDLVDVHGIVKDPSGRPVRNVVVRISGSLETNIITNGEGEFELRAINRNGQYNLLPTKNINHGNGVSAIDLLLIQKHVLQKDTFDFQWQRLAADATNNVTISVGDIVILLKLLLGKIDELPSSPAWRFDPPYLDLNALPPGQTFEVQFQAIKVGDVNGTADPTQ